MRRKFSLAAILLLLASAVQAQQKVTDAPSVGTEAKPVKGGGYYAAFRTSAHIVRSTPEIFHGVSRDLLDYLKSKGVPIVADPERGVLETSDQMSTESMLRIAKSAGASGLLLVTVDRPAASWLKITVQSFDESGKQLWEENADKKSGLNGKSAPHDVGEKIKSMSMKRICLPWWVIKRTRSTRPPLGTGQAARRAACPAEGRTVSPKRRC